LEMQARSSDGYAMDWLWPSLYHALAMLWATFWALVLGFTISGVLQVFVTKERMSRAFGQTNLQSVSLATGLGAASSSCSYAAVAAARSEIQQGAALIPVLVFMFAWTNEGTAQGRAFGFRMRMRKGLEWRTPSSRIGRCFGKKFLADSSSPVF